MLYFFDSGQTGHKFFKQVQLFACSLNFIAFTFPPRDTALANQREVYWVRYDNKSLNGSRLLLTKPSDGKQMLTSDSARPGLVHCTSTMLLTIDQLRQLYAMLSKPASGSYFIRKILKMLPREEGITFIRLGVSVYNISLIFLRMIQFVAWFPMVLELFNIFFETIHWHSTLVCNHILQVVFVLLTNVQHPV